jgi:predicted DNA-binding ribbon-helix-helix protein
MKTKTPFYIRLRADLMDILREESERRGMTMTMIIERALDAQFGAERGNVVNLQGDMPENKDGL